jgi:hypothetical protein
MAATMATTSAFTGTSLAVQTRRCDPFPLSGLVPSKTRSKPWNLFVSRQNGCDVHCVCCFCLPSGFWCVSREAIVVPLRDSKLSVHVLSQTQLPAIPNASLYLLAYAAVECGQPL